MLSKSASAAELYSTRKAMFPAKILMNFFSGPGASRHHVFISTANRLNRRLKILPFPFERIGQYLIERLGGRLPMTLSVIIELSFALGREGNHLHAPTVGFPLFCVNTDGQTWAENNGSASGVTTHISEFPGTTGRGNPAAPDLRPHASVDFVKTLLLYGRLPGMERAEEWRVAEGMRGSGIRRADHRRQDASLRAEPCRTEDRSRLPVRGALVCHRAVCR